MYVEDKVYSILFFLLTPDSNNLRIDDEPKKTERGKLKPYIHKFVKSGPGNAIKLEEDFSLEKGDIMQGFLKSIKSARIEKFVHFFIYNLKKITDFQC